MERTGIVQHLLPCIREARQAFKTIASPGGNRLLRFREREEATVTSDDDDDDNSDSLSDSDPVWITDHQAPRKEPSS